MTPRKIGFASVLTVLVALTLAPLATAPSGQGANRCDGSDRQISITLCLKALRGD